MAILIVIAVLASGLVGMVVGRYVSHWIVYVIDVVVGPIVSIAAFIGSGLLLYGDSPLPNGGEFVTRGIGQSLWAGIMGAVVGTYIAKRKRDH